MIGVPDRMIVCPTENFGCGHVFPDWTFRAIADSGEIADTVVCSSCGKRLRKKYLKRRALELMQRAEPEKYAHVLAERQRLISARVRE